MAKVRILVGHFTIWWYNSWSLLLRKPHAKLAVSLTHYLPSTRSEAHFLIPPHSVARRAQVLTAQLILSWFYFHLLYATALAFNRLNELKPKINLKTATSTHNTDKLLMNSLESIILLIASSKTVFISKWPPTLGIFFFPSVLFPGTWKVAKHVSRQCKYGFKMINFSLEATIIVSTNFLFSTQSHISVELKHFTKWRKNSIFGRDDFNQSNWPFSNETNVWNTRISTRHWLGCEWTAQTLLACWANGELLCSEGVLYD